MLRLLPYREAKQRERLLQEQLAQFTASSPDLESIRGELVSAREEAVTCRRKLEEREALCATGSNTDLVRESEEKSKEIQNLRLQVEQANTVSDPTIWLVREIYPSVP